MKTKMRLFTVALMIVALVTAAFPGAGLAKENKSYFTGQECPVEWTDIGTWTYLPSGLVRVTGLHSTQYDSSDDPRINGFDYIIINAITDAEGVGNFWGTFNIVNDGGSWFGHWNGQNPGGQFYIDGQLQGEGGYEGLTANFNLRPGDEECSVISGYIVETGAGN